MKISLKFDLSKVMNKWDMANWMEQMLLRNTSCLTELWMLNLCTLACSSWSWLSESYSCVFKLVFYTKIWSLASFFIGDFWPLFGTRRTKKQCKESDVIIRIFVKNMDRYTNKYDTESHGKKLHADVTFINSRF